MPEKPIATVELYVLLRRHGGTAWFRHVALHQLAGPPGTLTFDNVPISRPTALPPSGFQVRDVAADGSFMTFENGEAIGLRLTTTREQRDGVTRIQAELRDLTGKDRAVTLYYALVIPPGPRVWLHGPLREEPVKGRREYFHGTHFKAGANGRSSLYPLAAVRRKSRGTALAIDPFTPAFSRLCFHAGTGELYVAYDLALTPEKPVARVKLLHFDFAAAWGFRAAWARYMALFPEAFRCRVPRQGLWMPFAKISAVQGWHDFGFRFKEGTNETEWDDAHDILTFRYTEPMTWWMRLPKDVPRTLAAGEALVRKAAAEHPTGGNGRRARALLTCGHYDEQGHLVGQVRDTPWCNGIVWSVNSMPGIRGEVTDFHLKWNGELKKTLYGPDRKGNLDGEYVDSSEGYVTALLDFRRDHFAAAKTPLTFSTSTHKPAIFRGLIATEYVRALARDVHAMNKLMMANSTPSRIWYLAPWLDVLGTETNWHSAGAWNPLSAEAMIYRRTLCGPKPYCFLQNTVFEEFSPDMVEKYMKRSLAFGMFPGFFSHNASQGHYFSRPKLYNRDRPLFKKYIPLCKQVAEAGWQPITNARTTTPGILVERFGDHLLTVFNPGKERKDVALTILFPVGRVRNLLDGRELSVERRGKKASLHFGLNPEDVAVLDCSTP